MIVLVARRRRTKVFRLRHSTQLLLFLALGNDRRRLRHEVEGSRALSKEAETSAGAKSPCMHGNPVAWARARARLRARRTSLRSCFLLYVAFFFRHACAEVQPSFSASKAPSSSAGAAAPFPCHPLSGLPVQPVNTG